MTDHQSTRISALFLCCWDTDLGLRHDQTIELLGNALDVACGNDGRSIIVSIDNVHSKGSTTAINDYSNEDTLLQMFCREEPVGLWIENVRGIKSSINEHGNILEPEVLEESRSGKPVLSELLYAYEAIRKQDRESTR